MDTAEPAGTIRFEYPESELCERLSGELVIAPANAYCQIAVLKDSTIAVYLRQAVESEQLVSGFGERASEPDLDGVSGVVDDGRILRLSGRAFWQQGRLRFGLEALREFRGFLNGTVELSARNAQASLGERFTLVNLQLDGQDEVEDQNGSHRGSITFELGKCRVVLTQRQGYVSKVAELQALRRVVATYDATVIGNVSSGEAELIVERLCALLTIATGALVTWTEHRGVDRDGQATLRYRSAITRPYTPTPLLDLQRPELIKRFVSNAWGRYEAIDRAIPIRQLAHAWVDLGGHSFLQSRALTAASLIELLTMAVGKASKWPRAFREQAPYVERLIGALQHLGVPFEVVAVNAVKSSRNKVVHQLTLGDRPADAFSGLVNLLGQMILAVFGYEGPHLGWPGKRCELRFAEDRDWDARLK